MQEPRKTTKAQKPFFCFCLSSCLPAFLRVIPPPVTWPLLLRESVRHPLRQHRVLSGRAIEQAIPDHDSAAAAGGAGVDAGTVAGGGAVVGVAAGVAHRGEVAEVAAGAASAAVGLAEDAADVVGEIGDLGHAAAGERAGEAGG